MSAEMTILNKKTSLFFRMKPISNGSARAGRRISPAGDRRREPRFEATGAGKLIVRNSANDSELSAVVIDVSRSGFQVELARALESGESVELRLGKVKLFGDVVSCRKRGENCYRVCVTTILFVEPSLPPKAARK
jgi:hypothetical protein